MKRCVFILTLIVFQANSYGKQNEFKIKLINIIDSSLISDAVLNCSTSDERLLDDHEREHKETFLLNFNSKEGYYYLDFKKCEPLGRSIRIHIQENYVFRGDLDGDNYFVIRKGDTTTHIVYVYPLCNFKVVYLKNVLAKDESRSVFFNVTNDTASFGNKIGYRKAQFTESKKWFYDASDELNLWVKCVFGISVTLDVTFWKGKDFCYTSYPFVVKSKEMQIDLANLTYKFDRDK